MRFLFLILGFLIGGYVFTPTMDEMFEATGEVWKQQYTEQFTSVWDLEIKCHTDLGSMPEIMVGNFSPHYDTHIGTRSVIIETVNPNEQLGQWISCHLLTK